MNGAELIAAERERQIADEGYTPEGDAAQITALIFASRNYGRTAVAVMGSLGTIHEWTVKAHLRDFADEWPWRPETWKPTGDPVRDLTKAGALIAAAIDALNRTKEET